MQSAAAAGTAGGVAKVNHLLKRWTLGTVILALALSYPLSQYLRFAWESDLYSHLILVPWISFFCVWSARGKLVEEPGLHRGWVSVLLAIGLLTIMGLAWAGQVGWKPLPEDRFAVLSFSGYMLWLAICGYFFGPNNLRLLAFPLIFMAFAIPMPSAARAWLESFLQHGSADVAQLLFNASGMPLVRDKTLFVLPGMRLEVAPECSGIHSTLVLFLTSIIAGYFFLNRPWRRAVLILAVLPLALLRNGFRVFVIGQLCVNVSPDMINSYIHRKGGPIFFGLSLIPFVLLLLWLWRMERRRLPAEPPHTAALPPACL